MDFGRILIFGVAAKHQVDSVKCHRSILTLRVGRWNTKIEDFCRCDPDRWAGREVILQSVCLVVLDKAVTDSLCRRVFAVSF